MKTAQTQLDGIIAKAEQIAEKYNQNKQSVNYGDCVDVYADSLLLEELSRGTELHQKSVVLLKTMESIVGNRPQV